MKFYYCLQAPNSIGFGKESERSMIMTKSIRDDIPSTQESLVKWALDNGCSPVTSYTVAPVANRFHLRLENNGKYDFFFCIKNIPQMSFPMRNSHFSLYGAVFLLQILMIHSLLFTIKLKVI